MTSKGFAMQNITYNIIYESGVASDAHIFSLNQISEDTRRTCFMRRWWSRRSGSGFSVFAFPTPADEIKRFAPVVRDVKLVYPDNWDVIDKWTLF